MNPWIAFPDAYISYYIVLQDKIYEFVIQVNSLDLSELNGK